MADTLKLLMSKNHFELKEISKKSAIWFEQQVFNLIGLSETPTSMLIRGNRLTSNVDIGSMYFFAYDPKTKLKLPYYDCLPLVLPFNVDATGFYGLNLHYLPYEYRIKLLNKLLDFTGKKLSDSTKLNLSWQLLNGVSRYKDVKPCVKHYLFDHVRTPFKKIVYNDWATACMLPFEQFEKASKYEVWMDSVRK